MSQPELTKLGQLGSNKHCAWAEASARQLEDSAKGGELTSRLAWTSTGIGVRVPLGLRYAINLTYKE